MKILVTGANGFLGKKAMEIFRKDNEVIGTSHSGKNGLKIIDITDYDEVDKIIEEEKPNVIFNTAAMIDVAQCESEKENAKKLNVDAAVHLAEICKEKKIKLIVISSDYIFSGDNSPYDENSEAHPKSYYGETKKLMEKLVLETNPDAIVIRPGILYGFNAPNGKDKLITPVIDKINKCEEIIIDDLRPKYPVIIDDIPKNTLILIEKNEKGVFNFASEEKVDRYTSAIIVAKEFGLDENKIKKEKPKEFPDRPYDVQLNNNRASYLKFLDFSEGVKLVKEQMEKC